MIQHLIRGTNLQSLSETLPKRVRFCSRIVLALLFLLVFSTTLVAQIGHTIRGKVRTAAGKNAAQVLVELQSGNGIPIGKTTTNNEGDFYFGGLGESSYTVIVSAPDYELASEQVRFIRNVGADQPGETQIIEITLIPKTASSPLFSSTPIFAQDVPPDARKKFDEARQLLKDNKASEALPLIQEALKIFPDYFDAHLAYGTELMKANRLNEAIFELEQARKINPKDARLYQLFGMILMQQQKPALAATVLAEATRLNPNDPQPHYLRATALIDSVPVINSAKVGGETEKRLQLLNEAEKALLLAFELSGKKMFTVYLQMARIYERRNESNRAADELEKYLKSSPNDKNAAAIRDAIAKLRGKR